MALKIYKALSVVEPWGDFIARGKKTIEVRTWISDQIGPDEDLLIVQNKKLLSEEDMTDADGRAVALVRVKEMRPFVYADRAEAKTERFAEGWYAWVLTDLRPVRGRVPCLAARKIYEVELESLDVES